MKVEELSADSKLAIENVRYKIIISATPGKKFRIAPYFIMHTHLINYAFYPLSLNTIDNSLGN